MSIPNPTIMTRFAPKPAEIETETTDVVLADLEPQDPGKIVRPGHRVVPYDVKHDGVIKAKQVKENMVVQAFLHGKPCGGKRTVSKVTRSEDGGIVTLEFSSPHPTTEYKAAYRFFVQELVGTTIRRSKRVPALVPYEEV